MSPNRFLSQQLADVALGLMAGVGRIWRAGGGMPRPPRLARVTDDLRRGARDGMILDAG